MILMAGANLSAQQGGYALEFGGTKYANCGNDASVSISGTAISLEAWIYPTAFSTNSWDNVIVNKLANTTHGYNLRCGGAGIVEFYVSYNFLNTGFATSSQGAIELNKWTHLAGTYDGANVKLYINGKLTVTTAYTESIPAQDMPLIIGNHGDTQYPTRPFIGKIDEVRIWNITRTEAEIKANMYKEISAHTNLKAYYQMSDGTGTSLTDNSGNSNTGTLTNGASWRISGCFAGSRQALDFDGTDCAVAMTSDFGNNFNSINKFSFAGWVYPTMVSINNWGSFFSLESSSTGGRIVIHEFPSASPNPDGTEEILISISQNTGAGYGHGSTSSNILVPNRWAHVAFVYDGTQTGNNNRLKLYVNGKEEPLTFSGTIPPTTTHTYDSYHIGWYSYLSHFKGGKLDEFSFWNVSLSESQIREIMFKSLAGDESGLFAYYRFDQSDGATLYDITANGYNGTLINMDPATDWVASGAFNTWLGGESNSWGNAANWSNGVPAAAQSAGIYNWSSALPNVTSYLPVIPTTVSINNLLVPSGVNASGNVNLTATGSVFLGSSITLASSALNTADILMVESGNILTLPTGGQLTVARQLDNQGSFTIQSGGSLIINGVLNNNGTITSERPFPQTTQAWHMLAAPIAGGIAANGFNPGENDAFYAWHEPYPGTWVNYKNTTAPPTFTDVNGGDNFVPGKGYLVAYTGENPSKTFTGTLNTGDVNFVLKNSGATKAWTYITGWNLIGNPYSSGIDWNKAARTQFQDNFAYVYNPNKDGGAGYVDIDGGAEDAFIGPHQAFFVLAKTEANDQNFTFTNAIQVHDGDFMKNSHAGNGIVLRLSNDQYYDETTIRLREDALKARDRQDAVKMYSFDAQVPQLYSIPEDEIPLSVNSLPEVDPENAIALGTKIPANGQFTISLVQSDEIMESAGIYLEDRLTGIIHKLSDAAYSFSAEMGDHTGRFYLYFGMVSIHELQPEIRIPIWQEGQRVCISGAEKFDHIQLFDLQGRLLLQKQINGEGLQQIAAPHVSGIYIIRLSSRQYTIHQKIVIN